MTLSSSTSMKTDCRTKKRQALPNVTVTLTGGGADGVLGTLDDTTTVQQTDISGFYNFTGLNPGEEYRVAFSDLPVDYVLTLANQGLNDLKLTPTQIR